MYHFSAYTYSCNFLVPITAGTKGLPERRNCAFVTTEVIYCLLKNVCVLYDGTKSSNPVVREVSATQSTAFHQGSSSLKCRSHCRAQSGQFHGKQLGSHATVHMRRVRRVKALPVVDAAEVSTEVDAAPEKPSAPGPAAPEQPRQQNRGQQGDRRAPRQARLRYEDLVIGQELPGQVVSLSLPA